MHVSSSIIWTVRLPQFIINAWCGALWPLFSSFCKNWRVTSTKKHGRTTLFRKCASLLNLLIEYLSWGTNLWFNWKISKNLLTQTVGTDFNHKDWTAVVLPLLAVVVLVVSFYVFLSPPKVGLVAGRKLVWKCNLVTFVCYFFRGLGRLLQLSIFNCRVSLLFTFNMFGGREVCTGIFLRYKSSRMLEF